MRTIVAGLLAVVAGTACYTMAPLSLDQISVERPTRVWVTTADRSRVEVNGPQVFGDTLVGYVGGDFRELPTGEIAQVAIKRAAKGKTMALVAASIASAALVGVAISGLGAADPAAMIDCNEFPDEPECNGQIP